MKEATRKIVKALEENEIKFNLVDGAENDTDYDSVYLSFTGELKNNEIGIHIDDDFINIISFMINTVKEEKYPVLADTLNTLNAEYRFVKFSARKAAGEEEYYVAITRDDFYYDNYDPEVTFDLIDLILSIIDESYPIIVKAIL